MKIFILFSIFYSFLFTDEGIRPVSFRVQLVKACEVLMLSEAPKRKAKRLVTHFSSGSCVQNFGCMREVTQKELDAMSEIKRAHMAWKYPVWCKVDADGVQGWVRRQFLSEDSCKENNDT